MADTCAPAVVIDCSGLPGREDVDRLHQEAYEAFKQGKLDIAHNIRGQADRMADNLREGPLEQTVPLTEEDLAQRAADEAHHRTVVAPAMLRANRNARLAASDWTQLPDAALTKDERAAWTRYRQQLRDLPAITDPLDPAWPVPPA